MELTVELPIKKEYDPLQIIEDFTTAIKVQLQHRVKHGMDQPFQALSKEVHPQYDMFPVYIIWDPELKVFKKKLTDLIEMNPKIEDEVRDIARTIGLILPVLDRSDSALPAV